MQGIIMSSVSPDFLSGCAGVPEFKKYQNVVIPNEVWNPSFFKSKPKRDSSPAGAGSE
jgi:hypothetical protein